MSKATAHLSNLVKIARHPFWLFFTLLSALLGDTIHYRNYGLIHLTIPLLALATLLGLGKEGVKSAIKRLHEHKYLLFFVIWIAGCLVTASWAVSWKASAYYMKQFSAGFVFFLLMIWHLDSKEKIVTSLKLVRIILGVGLMISMLEIFTDFRMPHSSFSPYFCIFEGPGCIWEPIHPNYAHLLPEVPTGFFSSQNRWGLSIILLLPFIFPLSKRTTTIFAFICLVYVSLFALGSRASFSICAALLISMYWFYFKSYILKIFATLLTLTFFILPITTNFFTFSIGQSGRLQEITQATVGYLSPGITEASVEDRSSEGIRRYMISKGLESLEETEWLGLGPGNFPVYIAERKLEHKRIKHMHNFLMEVLVEGGFFTFLTVLFLIFNVLLNALSALLKSQDPLLRGLIYSASASFGVWWVANISISRPMAYHYWWVVLAFLTAAIRLARQSSGVSTEWVLWPRSIKAKFSNSNPAEINDAPYLETTGEVTSLRTF